MNDLSKNMDNFFNNLIDTMPNNSKSCTSKSFVGSSDPGEGTGEGRFFFFIHAFLTSQHPHKS